MDPLSIPLDEDDLRAPDFPLPGEINEVSARIVAAQDENDAEFIIGDWFSPRPERPLHTTRCTSMARSTGERCRKWSVIGFTRCPDHMGWGKVANLTKYRERVIERARIELLRTTPFAIETLTEMVRDRDLNPQVRLKASLEVLDRVGIRGGSELSVEADVNVNAVDPATEVRMRLDRLRNAATTAALLAPPADMTGEDQSPSPASESEIVDAEIVA